MNARVKTLTVENIYFSTLNNTFIIIVRDFLVASVEDGRNKRLTITFTCCLFARLKKTEKVWWRKPYNMGGT